MTTNLLTTAAGSEPVEPAVASLLGMEPAADPAALDRLVAAGACFSLFSLPNPASKSTGIPLISWLPPLAIGFQVSEDLHRFEVRELAPSPVCGLRVRQARGEEQVARVSMQMTPMPNYFQAAPDRVPPPTLLLPFLSQRFAPMNGSFNFFDAASSGFQAFGAGRTLPVSAAGVSQTQLAAVIDVTAGTGRLAGLSGTGIIIGDIQPPSGFAFNVMLRFMDPGGVLQAGPAPGPLVEPSDPTPDTTFMPFLAERDPAQPLAMTVDPGGRTARLKIAERLRQVDLSFAVGPPGLRSQSVPGEIVGRHSMTLVIDLTHPGPVLPGYSLDGEFSFFDGRGTPVGSFRADLLEARVFPTVIPGQGTILRLGGFAPPSTGTGQFRQPVGMVSVNGALSPATGAISTVYMLRLADPLGVFRPVTPAGGGHA